MGKYFGGIAKAVKFYAPNSGAKSVAKHLLNPRSIATAPISVPGAIGARIGEGTRVGAAAGRAVGMATPILTGAAAKAGPAGAKLFKSLKNVNTRAIGKNTGLLLGADTLASVAKPAARFIKHKNVRLLATETSNAITPKLHQMAASGLVGL